MTRKICVVTGTRAEYGLLRWLMQGIKDDTALELQIITTGMHLSPEFGLTYREIEKDGFTIDRKVEMLMSSDTPVGISKSMGLGMIGFADALDGLNPDLLVLLGDRFEILSAASAALVARVPVAHIHGGETTEGAIDESIRHSITKMSHLHFTAAEEYKRRVIQLGENPQNVFLVGGLGVDVIKKLKLFEKPALEDFLRFQFGVKNLLVTFHPATLEKVPPEEQMAELLAALSELKDTGIIFTMPNADTGGRKLLNMVNEFLKQYSNACVHFSLGQLAYLSCVRFVDGVVGNSSSGLLEVPTFKKGTINIGDRQKGRLKAKSVIDCLPHRRDILVAIKKLYSFEFRASLSEARNPYGDGGASEKILEVIKSVSFDHLTQKSFFDIPYAV
jgi:GDP/UDP-N,N'-diacetylbacillosamine 2-epimerase (hydrolysing)